METQEFFATRQFLEGIADPEAGQVVRLSSSSTLQEAVVKARARARAIDTYEEAEVAVAKYSKCKKQNSNYPKPTRWNCGLGHFHYECKKKSLKKTAEKGTTY